MPAYKVEKYIEACVESVLSQHTHYSILLTIVNDGSPDDTRQILRKYENTPHVEIIDQENKGFSGARNAALQTIKASYLMFLDSDDLLAPGSIEALMDKAVSINSDVVEGSYTTFTDTQQAVSVVKHKNVITDKWLGLLFGFPWGKVFRSELFANLQFPEGYWFEDTVISFLVYPQCKRIATINNIVYHYRCNPKGITASSRGNIKCLDTLLITIQLLKEVKQLGLALDEQMYDMFLLQVRNNYGRINSLRNLELNKLVFSISCSLKKEYFPNGHTQNKNLNLIEQALLGVDYAHYLLAVV